MPRIFISYRRDDSAADMTDRLYERLAQRWGRQVFMDLDSIVGGDLFEKKIEENLRNCSVMLVIIGRHWASLKDEKGLRRIDDPRDYPRMEVAAALRRGVRVIPVLVGDALLPKPEELPQDIAGLLARQYVRVSRESFGADVQNLIEAVAHEMPQQPWRQLPWKVASIAVVLLIAAAVAYFTLGDREIGDRVSTVAKGPEAAKVEAPAAAVTEAPVGASRDDPASPAGKGESSVAEKAKPRPTVEARAEPTGTVDVSGRWETGPVTAAYGNPSFTLRFEFTQVDDQLLGTVTETRADRTRGVNRPIFDGTIRKNVISFHTKGELIGGRDGATTPYREMYIGTLQNRGREIAFRRFNDVSTGGEIETFVAAR